VASDRMKARYDRLANSAGFQEGDSLSVPPDPDQRKVTQAAVGMGRPVQGHHPD
jgi:hypothetical protein